MRGRRLPRPPMRASDHSRWAVKKGDDDEVKARQTTKPHQHPRKPDVSTSSNDYDEPEPSVRDLILPSPTCKPLLYLLLLLLPPTSQPDPQLHQQPDPKARGGKPARDESSVGLFFLSQSLDFTWMAGSRRSRTFKMRGLVSATTVVRTHCWSRAPSSCQIPLVSRVAIFSFSSSVPELETVLRWVSANQ